MVGRSVGSRVSCSASSVSVQRGVVRGDAAGEGGGGAQAAAVQGGAESPPARSAGEAPEGSVTNKKLETRNKEERSICFVWRDVVNFVLPPVAQTLEELPLESDGPPRTLPSGLDSTGLPSSTHNLGSSLHHYEAPPPNPYSTSPYHSRRVGGEGLGSIGNGR